MANSPKHATWNISDFVWGQTKNGNQLCQNSPGETVGERSHFSPPRAFLRQNSPLQPLFPLPQPLIRREDKKQSNKQQINYSETTCVVRRGVKCRTELEFPAFIVPTRGDGLLISDSSGTLTTCPDPKIPALWLSPAFDSPADNTSCLAVIDFCLFGFFQAHLLMRGWGDGKRGWRGEF